MGINKTLDSAIKTLHQYLLYCHIISRNRRVYKTMKEIAFGINSEIPENIEKEFDSEFLKNKDVISNTLSSIKTEMEKDSIKSPEEKKQDDTEEIPEIYDEVCDDVDDLNPHNKMISEYFSNPKSLNTETSTPIKTPSTARDAKKLIEIKMKIPEENKSSIVSKRFHVTTLMEPINDIPEKKEQAGIIIC